LPTLVVTALTIAAGCGAGEETPPRASSAPPPASSAALGKLKSEQNRLLDGGPEAFEARLAELRGHPVVVNQWASWCDPCRREFPFFRAQAENLEGRVAFLGVNAQDNREDAAAFLSEIPVPFPHFYDKDASIARLFHGGRAWPTTAFYEASGKLVFTHQGAYATEAKLAEDIERYAIGG
jgi:cytochrome c biogenesis protein CcmG/thiol:disulfide interchange protein DsbE